MSIRYRAPKLPRGEVKVRTAAWNKRRKPASAAERNALFERCGAPCFLSPAPLKYPICAKRAPGCDVDCVGLRAARNNAAIVRNRKTISAEARRRGQVAYDRAGPIGVASCEWVRVGKKKTAKKTSAKKKTPAKKTKSKKLTAAAVRAASYREMQRMAKAAGVRAVGTTLALRRRLLALCSA